MMEAVRISETLVNLYKSTRRCNSVDSHLHAHQRQNLKSYLVYILHYINGQNSSTGEDRGGQASVLSERVFRALHVFDFCLWGCVKYKVYCTQFTGGDLKTRMGNAVACINRGMLARTWKELKSRLDVLASRVAHIELH
jgi:hypothetical protein